MRSTRRASRRSQRTHSRSTGGHPPKRRRVARKAAAPQPSPPGGDAFCDRAPGHSTARVHCDRNCGPRTRGKSFSEFVPERDRGHRSPHTSSAVTAPRSLESKKTRTRSACRQTSTGSQPAGVLQTGGRTEALDSAKMGRLGPACGTPSPPPADGTRLALLARKNPRKRILRGPIETHERTGIARDRRRNQAPWPA